MKNKNIILVIALVLILVGIYFATSGSEEGGSVTQALVALAASVDKETYASGETVTLSLSLTNTGEDVTCVSDNSQGNIAFLSLTRDGESVPSRTAPSDFLEALSMLVTADLSEIAPGETTTITAPSSYDPGLDAEALYTSTVEEDTTFYDVSLPGVYEIEIAYRYAGNQSAECPSIFADQTNTATVSFTIE